MTPTFVPLKAGSEWLPEQIPWEYDDEKPCDGYGSTTSIDENGQISVTHCPEFFIQ
jgi:hypothetical protein